jgi:hypothetical protein
VLMRGRKCKLLSPPLHFTDGRCSNVYRDWVTRFKYFFINE